MKIHFDLFLGGLRIGDHKFWIISLIKLSFEKDPRKDSATAKKEPVDRPVYLHWNFFSDVPDWNFTDTHTEPKRISAREDKLNQL